MTLEQWATDKPITNIHTHTHTTYVCARALTLGKGFLDAVYKLTRRRTTNWINQSLSARELRKKAPFTREDSVDDRTS